MDTTQSAGLALTPEVIEGMIDAIVTKAAERISAASEKPGGLQMARAWVFQDDKQVKKHGEANASHYVGYYDPSGKKRCQSCGKGAEGLKNARKLKRKIEAQLIEGTFETNSNRTWKEFRQEYDLRILSGKSDNTQMQTRRSLGNFERLAKPGKVSAIRTATIDQFIAARRQERQQWRKDGHEPKRKPKNPYRESLPVSAATVNADIRNVRTALTVARQWGYIKELPVFRLLKLPKKLPVFVRPEDFDLIYGHADAATLPNVQGVTPGDWWRGFLVFVYVATGWRVSEVLALRREDLNLEKGIAITRAEDNKCDRDEAVKLHPVAVVHLEKLIGFGPLVFATPHDRKTLWKEFRHIQEAAGIKLAGTKPFYSFHDLRRGFGTLNAERMTPRVLQHFMRHKSYQTTQQFYLNPLPEMEQAVNRMHVPPGLTG